MNQSICRSEVFESVLAAPNNIKLTIVKDENGKRVFIMNQHNSNCNNLDFIDYNNIIRFPRNSTST